MGSRSRSPRMLVLGECVLMRDCRVGACGSSHGHLGGLLRPLAASAAGAGAGAGGLACQSRSGNLPLAMAGCQQAGTTGLLGVRRWQWAAAKQWSSGGQEWYPGGVGCGPQVAWRVARAWAWCCMLAVLSAHCMIKPQVWHAVVLMAHQCVHIACGGCCLACPYRLAGLHAAICVCTSGCLSCMLPLSPHVWACMLHRVWLIGASSSQCWSMQSEHAANRLARWWQGWYARDCALLVCMCVLLVWHLLPN